MINKTERAHTNYPFQISINDMLYDKNWSLL